MASRTPTKSGVEYYYHFPKAFLRPYGPAFQEHSFGDDAFKKQLKPNSAELLNRPDVGMSELAETLTTNLQYVEENTDEFMGALPRFMQMTKNIDNACKIVSVKHDGQGDMTNAIHEIASLELKKSKFLDAFLEEGLKYSASLFLALVHFKAARVIFQNPDTFSQKVDSDKFKNYMKSKTTEGLMLDVVGHTSVKTPLKSPMKRTTRLCDISDDSGASEKSPEVEEEKQKKKKKKTKRNLIEEM